MPYSQYVNIKQGTRSSSRYSNGNTLPIVQLPFGMNGFTLQTNSNRNPWFYHPDDRSLEGIRLTHQPSPWIGDYTPLVMLPQRETFTMDPNMRWSGFKPEDTRLQPHCMHVNLLRYKTALELAPTMRGGIIRLTYSGDERAGFSLFAKGTSGFAIDVDNKAITGYTTYCANKCAENFRMYFIFAFDCALQENDSFVMDCRGKSENAICIDQKDCGINACLSSHSVCVRFATSFISLDQAKRNLEQEAAGRSFESIRAKAERIWERSLSRIEIESESVEQLKLFYSCMYRVFLYPSVFYELDENRNAIHFCADTGKIYRGVKYVNHGTWDTYRTVYPLFSLVAPEEFSEIVEGYINTYRDCGWLPKWPSPAETGAMPGTMIDAVIAEAAVKNICGADVLKEALEGLLTHASNAAKDARYGRKGVEDYLKYGYLPCDLYSESVSATLDYAYGDFCIAQVARTVGRDEDARRMLKQSKNYQNLFDVDVMFIRGKDHSGDWKETFDPFAWGDEYCEGGPWQSLFAVNHDIDGLTALFGSKEKLIVKIDQLFAMDPDYRCGGYGREIHEMTEMAAMDFGQCAISNQPSLHIPYLYAVLNEKGKTEYWVARILQQAFSAGDDGYPGDDDTGTLAAWVIFSLLGLYPFCPGTCEYLKLKPHVKRAVLHCKHNDYSIDQSQNDATVLQHACIVKNSR